MDIDELRSESSVPTKKAASGSRTYDRKVWIYRRKIVALLAFFGFFMAYVLRTNLSVAIVAMTKWQNVTVINITELVSTNASYRTREFDWNSKKRGKILSSFFYGYIFTQVLGGWLSTRVGGVKVFGSGIVITGIIALIIPFLARGGMMAMIGMRAMQGFFQGATYPSIHSVWARWAPPEERTKLASIGFSGGFMGTMFAFPMCGFLAENYGWKSTFFVPGIMSSVWGLLWFIFVSEDPENDRFISTEELLYLRETISEPHDAKIKHPWLTFFKSMPVWAIIVAHFCENWGFYTMVTMLPTYFHDTWGLSIRTSGTISSFPFLFMGVGLPIAGSMVDRVRRKKKISLTTIRKLFNTVAFVLQLIFMMAASYAQRVEHSIIFLTFSIGMGAFAWAAFSVNHLDIAAPHAGVLMGISNMMATISGIVSPSVAGYLSVDKTREEWRIIFSISSGMYLFGAIFYGIFASGERQPWVVQVKDEQKIILERQESAFEFF